MHPLPEFLGETLGLTGHAAEEPITETEIARDRRIAAELRRKLASLRVVPEPAVRAA